MVAPIVTAALISGGASLLGGAIASRSARRQQDSNAAIQREFAQHGIRWKVADAKAAGLHPLYAMQGSGTSYTPTVYSDPMGPAIAQAGQQIGRAVEEKGAYDRDYYKRMNTHRSQMLDMELKSATIRRMDAETAYWQKEAGQPDASGAVQVVPDRQVSAREGKGHLTAATKPLFTEYQGPGYKIMLPYSEEGPTEGLQVGIPQLAWILAENMRYYGPGWAPHIRKYINVPLEAWERAKQLLQGPAEIFKLKQRPGIKAVPLD